MNNPKAHRWDHLPSKIGTLFIDSGAHSLYNRKVLKAQPGVAKGKGDYSFYDLTPGSEFRQYLESYARFIKRYGYAIDHYFNVDAIFNPALTWEIQKVLEEEYGLHPVPVIHYGAELSWLEKYFEKGYDYIGIGGLGQGVSKQEFLGWGDKVFSFLCPEPTRLPVVRTHGFAITSWELLTRYPWWSVDSASWLKAAAYGQVYIPHFSEGRFLFDRPPIIISISDESPNRNKKGKHLMTLSEAERRVLKLWLEHIGVPLGSTEDQEWGALTHYAARAKVNLLYFHALSRSLRWPRPLKIDRKAVE